MGEELAEDMLDDAVPWGGDGFIHGAPRLRFSSPSGWLSRGSRGLTADLDGDTRVVVQDFSGVQVGDGNVQRNQFRARIIGVAARALAERRGRRLSTRGEGPGLGDILEMIFAQNLSQPCSTALNAEFRS